VIGASKTFDVSNALRFAGGRATTILGSNQLLLKLHAGGSGSLLAPTTLENAVFFENSGALALGSASGVALTLVCCAEVRNMTGGTLTLAGGDSRLYFNTGGTLVNNVGATLTITGNTLFGRPTTDAGLASLTNLGTMTVNGPGTLNMPLGVGIFQQFGDLSVTNATILCSNAAANPDKCSYSDSDSTHTGSITRLDDATLDLGGSTVNMAISAGSTVTGTGTINASLRLRGKIAPGALSGTPYGTLTVNGGLDVQQQFGAPIIDFDLGGGAGGNYDRLQVGGSVQLGTTTTFAGYGRLVLRLATGYTPALGAAVPVMGYASVLSGAAFNRIDANYALDYAARFDPTQLQVFPAPRISVDNASVIEGNSGTTPMTFNLRLSQASAQTVTVSLRPHDGTAVTGLPPSGDWLFAPSDDFTFAPGETLKPYTFPINGDTVVEADESFSVEILRNQLVNAAIGNGVPGDLSAVGTILTDELPANTRYLLVGKDSGAPLNQKIRRYTTAGIFIDIWNDQMPGGVGNIVTGLCFSRSGNVLATRFAWTGPIYYSHFGAVLDANFARPPGTSGFSNHESCAFDRAGNVYIGQAGVSSSPDTQVPVRKFDRYGTALEDFVVPTGTRGTDWIDLAGDQCTLYYTSEDTSVRRYNVCTHTVLPVFATGLTPPYCYALRLRANREVMVACQEAVHRLSPQGANLHTYSRASIGETDANGLFAMNLDPDGTSFWTAGLLSGNVYHVDIASGAVLGSFNSGAGGVAGLAVYDELGDDTLFVDGFESAPPLAPLVPSGPSSALFEPAVECESEFWPATNDMPHYVPSWMSVVVRDDGECQSD
jgi:hypothetical protein